MARVTSSSLISVVLHISRMVHSTFLSELLVSSYSCNFLIHTNSNSDYAAPEVLAGKPYRGKEQDVWALGILLYTIVYKENPFYSIDEIMDRDLRIPYIMSDDSIDLIRAMLDRDVSSRITIQEVIAHPWCVAHEEQEE